MSELLTVENLTIKSANQILVDNLSYTLHTGETLAIVGESGSGKSLSSLALLGLLPNSLSITGQAHLTDSQSDKTINLPIENSLSTYSKSRKQNQNVFRQIRGKRIGMIFQEPMTALNPLHTVGKQIAESL
ncbi:MAG TPA: microcin ABC transporter ATP-binding protein, partial [Moraxella sp.]|nr:microcin ABC transporter ATP-binding protein [Moraxella sp.]